MGPVFETMCAEYAGKANLANRLPFKVRQLGRWWGTNPETRSEEEIDLVGINDKESKALFCECKFRSQLFDLQTLNALLEKAGRWPNYRNKYFMLFSKSGFAREVLSTAKENNIQLVSLKEMYEASTANQKA
jgi:hypothetical protein